MDFLERKWHFPRPKIFGMHATCLGCMKVSRVKWMWFSSLPRVKTYGLQIVSAARKLNWWLTWWLEGNFHASRWQGVKALKKSANKNHETTLSSRGGTHIFFSWGRAELIIFKSFSAGSGDNVCSIGHLQRSPVNLWGLHCLHKNRPARGFSRWHKVYIRWKPVIPWYHRNRRGGFWFPIPAMK